MDSSAMHDRRKTHLERMGLASRLDPQYLAFKRGKPNDPRDSEPLSATPSLESADASSPTLPDFDCESDISALISRFPLPNNVAAKPDSSWYVFNADDIPAPLCPHRKEVPDIYFSLIESGSKAALSSPLLLPSALPTEPGSGLIASKSENLLTITSQQIDDLVKALANSSLVQERLAELSRKSRPQNTRDWPSQATAPVRSEVRKPNSEDTSRHLPRSHQILQRRYEETFAAQDPITRAPQAIPLDLTLVEAPNPDSEANLKRPSTTHPSCSLHLEPSQVPNDPLQLILTISVLVLNRITKLPSHFLHAQIDMTEPFTRAALFEFLQQSSSVEKTLSALRKLTQQTCTMQTLTLLSTLSRLVAEYRNFYILQPGSRTWSTGVPMRMTVPWVSAGLDQGRMSKLRRREVREGIVRVVARRCGLRREEFRARVRGVGVRCVPLVGEDGGVQAWGCFLQSESC